MKKQNNPLLKDGMGEYIKIFEVRRMKIYWKWLMAQIMEAEQMPGTIAIPLSEFDVEDLMKLADVCKERGLEIRIWHEQSNFSQKVLVEIQRFKERCSDPTKPQITYKN